MRSKILASAVTFAALAAAAPAYADGKDGQRPSFPMTSAAFKQHVDAKQAKMREHTEKRASTLPADQAKEVRAKLDAKLAARNAEVAKVIADGTVTQEEARAVRAAGGHAGGCDHGNKKSEKK